MKKRYLMIIILAVSVVLLLFMLISNRKVEKIAYHGNSETTEPKEFEWLEEEKRYVVYDENGDIRGYADDEYGLKIFQDNPDFGMNNVPTGYYDKKEIIEEEEP